jgi:hypothetical protein
MCTQAIDLDSPCQEDDAEQKEFRPSDMRLIVAGQLRLLAMRVERGLPLDTRSLLNAVRACRQLLLAESTR